MVFVSEGDLPSSSKEAETGSGNLQSLHYHATMLPPVLWERKTSLLLSESESEGAFYRSKPVWITRLGEVTCTYHGITMGAGPTLEQELAWLL